MNDEDMSDIIQKISNMMNNNNNNTSENTNGMSSDNSTESNFNIADLLNTMNFNSSNENNNNNQNNNFNFDIETLMKMKNIMDKVNSSKNSPEANLLLSLKPYLNNNRKQKLDQYMQILNITKIIEAFNSENNVGNNNV